MAFRSELKDFQSGTGDFAVGIQAVKNELREAEVDVDRQGRVYTLAEVSFACKIVGGEMGSISSGLYWWKQYYSDTLLFKLAAERLMSLRTVGSIAVERSAKTAKDDVLTTKRNSLTDGHAENNTRGHINIKLMLKHMKPMALAKKVNRKLKEEDEAASAREKAAAAGAKAAAAAAAATAATETAAATVAAAATTATE